MLGRRQQCRKQWRRKRSPCVIGSLVFLANRIGRTAEVPNHAPRNPHRGAVALQSRTALPPAKAAIRRTNVISGCTDATAAPRLRNAASSSLVSAPLECSATLPFQSISPASERAARAISSVRHTEPNQSALAAADKSVAARATYLLRQRPRLLQRRPARARHHRFDRIPRSLQRQGQSRPQIPRPHNRDPRLRCHARQHSRSWPRPPRRSASRSREPSP